MRPTDLDTLLEHWTLGDKLHYLANLCPSDVRAVELIVDDALRNRWPTVHRFLNILPIGDSRRAMK